MAINGRYYNTSLATKVETEPPLRHARAWSQAGAGAGVAGPAGGPAATAGTVPSTPSGAEAGTAGKGCV